jgi:alpha-L-fucosidase
MPTGEIEPRQVKRLAEMGRWLRDHGASIYGTRGGPFLPGPWGGSTRKGNTVYLHVLDSRLSELRLPSIPARIERISGASADGREWRQDESGIRIPLPARTAGAIDTVITLKLDRDCAGIPVVRLSDGSLTTGAKATASNVYENDPQYGPDKAVDGDPETRWATDAGTHSAWLQVDLGKPQIISSAEIQEEYAGRIEEFQLMAFVDGQWKEIAQGTSVGPDRTLSFPAVRAQLVRLDILKSSEGPTISEFKLFSAGK